MMTSTPIFRHKIKRNKSAKTQALKRVARKERAYVAEQANYSTKIEQPQTFVRSEGMEAVIKARIDSANAKQTSALIKKSEAMALVIEQLRRSSLRMDIFVIALTCVMAISPGEIVFAIERSHSQRSRNQAFVCAHYPDYTSNLEFSARPRLVHDFHQDP